MAAGTQQGHLDLQRGRAEDAQQLRLGLDLVRHQVEQGNLQRADILAQRHVLGNDRNALPVQHDAGGQVVGDFYGHGWGAVPDVSLERRGWRVHSGHRRSCQMLRGPGDETAAVSCHADRMPGARPRKYPWLPPSFSAVEPFISRIAARRPPSAAAR